MKNVITLLFLLINLNLYSQATLSIEIIAKEGDAVGTSFLENIRNPVTNPQGQVGFTFERTDGVDGMWFDDAPIFNEMQDVNVGGSFEGSSGIGTGGFFLISPKFNNADAVYNQDGLVLVKNTQAPGFDVGLSTTFHSRPFMSGDNNNYWIAGLNFTGGTSTEDRVLYQLVNNVPTPVYSSNDLVVEGFAVNRGSSGIDFDFFVSNNNQHLIQILGLNTGSSTNDNVVVLNGTTIVAREASPTNITGHNWDNFDVMTINNDGDYLFTGNTDGNSSEDEFIAFNGNIVIQEGDTLAGIPLESLTLNSVSLNDAGTVGFVLRANNQEHFFISDLQDVKGNARLIASVGDSLDVNNDGVVDFTITDFKGSTSFGNSLDLSDHDFAFLELDILPIAPSTKIEAIVKFFFNQCPLQITLNNRTDDFNSTVNRKAERITATNVIGANAQTSYEAANEIQLLPGFTVAAGAEFTASISTCENTINIISNAPVENRTAESQNETQSFQSADLQLNAFPNPTNGDTKIYIELPSPTTLSIQLFDQIGKLLQQLLPQQEKSAGAFQLEIPISQLPIGMNYIILQTTDSRVVRKLIRIR